MLTITTKLPAKWNGSKKGVDNEGFGMARNDPDVMSMAVTSTSVKSNRNLSKGYRHLKIVSLTEKMIVVSNGSLIGSLDRFWYSRGVVISGAISLAVADDIRELLINGFSV
jgi:hypothetical protein